VNGRDVLSMPDAKQLEAAQYFLSQFDALASSEAMKTPPVATMSDSCDRFATILKRSSVGLSVTDADLLRLQAAAMEWSTVPSHGDACLHNVVAASSGWVLIDTEKCALRYEWHDSVHLLMFSGSSAVRDAVRRSVGADEGQSLPTETSGIELSSRVARTALTPGAARSTVSMTFEDLVLAFVLVGAAEEAKMRPRSKDAFESSLRWHLGRPGVRDVLAGLGMHR